MLLFSRKTSRPQGEASTKPAATRTATRTAKKMTARFTVVPLAPMDRHTRRNEFKALLRNNLASCYSTSADRWRKGFYFAHEERAQIFPFLVKPVNILATSFDQFGVGEFPRTAQCS